MSLSVHHFLPGDRVEIREILNERIWTVRPVTVIEDSEDQFVSYLATGTLIDYPVDVEHGEKCFTMWLTGKWELVQKEFSASGMLRTTPRSVPFEVFTTVLPNGGVASWYVKCREPLCRRPTVWTLWTKPLTSLRRGTFRFGSVGIKTSSRWLPQRAFTARRMWSVCWQAVLQWKSSSPAEKSRGT